MTEKFGEMIDLLCKRYATIPRFVRYSYREDMQAFAAMTVCRVWRGFNPEKGDNPFAYYTRCIHNAFFQYNNSEYKERLVKDEIRIQNGLNASYGYGERNNDSEDKSDYHDSYGDTDYMDHHDSINPYDEDKVIVDMEQMPLYDPTAPGKVYELTDEDIKILSQGII
jgi:hypothetical protein